MTPVQFTVPGRAVAKKEQKPGRQGRPAGTRHRMRVCRYERLVARIAAPAFACPMEGYVGLRCRFYCLNGGHAEPGDADNLASTVMDALSGVAYVDDKQVKDLRSQVFGCSASDERVEVSIWPLEESATQPVLLEAAGKGRRGR